MSKMFMQQVKCHRQRAFSLIELMIAMAIGLFLLLGLGLVFISVSQTSSTQRQLAQLQDNERMAMTLLTDVVQEAGYFDNNSKAQMTIAASTALPAYAVPNTTTSFNAGQSVAGTHANGTSPPGDSISIRFSSTSADNIVNCQGDINAGTTSNTFYVDGNNYLTCSENGSAAQELVSGVTNLQILYGIDSQSSGSVDTYLYADKMSPVEWQNVRSVTITITFVNPLYKQGQNDNQPPTIVLTRVIQVMNQT